jgi:DnaJ-class molecular chaperone
MNLYILFCVVLILLAGGVLWLQRPKKCKECDGSGKIVCHDGPDFYYSTCFKCKGTGWRS